MNASDAALRSLVDAIVNPNHSFVREQLAHCSEMARAQFASGATRLDEEGYFIEPVKRWLVAGDTALHFAAAAYNVDAAAALIGAGASVNARNRHGHTPLHAAASGDPDSPFWSPQSQVATIRLLVAAGGDPNGLDKRGVAPLHVAVRSRCAAAVRALLELGANATSPNGSGTTPIALATQNTGRGGSGSRAAKEQQAQILQLLREPASRT